MCFEQARFLATVLLVLFCLTLNWANILTFNFTVICMAPKNNDDNANPQSKLGGSLHSISNLSSSNVDDGSIENSAQFFSEGSRENVGGKAAFERAKRDDENLTSLTLEANMLEKSEEQQKQQQKIPSYSFTSSERSQAMSVVAVGALLANFPVVVSINWHGPRVPFTLLGLLGAAVTAAVPWCLDAGFYWFLAARFLQGVAFAGDMATFGHFLANWTEHKRYAFLTASLALYVQLAPFFTFPAAGVLCSSSFGWPAVYYAHAIVTVCFFVLFGIFYKNSAFMPAEKQNNNKKASRIDPNSSGAELKVAADLEEQMEKNISGGTTDAASLNNECARERKKLLKLAKKSIPYREILTSTSIWAIFLSAIGDFTAVNLLYQFTPTYLYEVQGFEVMETGMMATVPPLVQAITKELAGLLNDRIPRSVLSERAKTKLFNSIALFSTAFFLLCLATIPSGHGYLALGLITAGEALLGFIVGGFYKAGPQLSGLYGPFVMGQISTALTLTMLVVPYVVSKITYENTFTEWAIAFCSVALVAFLCNCYYLVFAKAEPEYWATLDYFKERQAKQQKEANGSVKNGKIWTK